MVMVRFSNRYHQMQAERLTLPKSHRYSDREESLKLVSYDSLDERPCFLSRERFYRLAGGFSGFTRSATLRLIKSRSSAIPSA